MGDLTLRTLTLHTTPYGRPAAARLHGCIADAKDDDPLAPVTVVVPSNYVGVSMRRLLASGQLGPVTDRGTGIAGVTLLTVYRLAELLGAPQLAAAGRRPVSTPVIAAAVRGALRREPGVFDPVSEHPSTEEALVRAHRELSELRPAALEQLARTSSRARDVVRLHRAVRAALEPRWFEEADLMAAAVAAVEGGSPVLPDLGHLILHLPQQLSLPAAALLRTIAERAPVTVVAGRSGAARADAEVDRALRRLGLDPDEDDVAASPVTEVVVVSDAEEEVRAAVQRIVTAARRGLPLERMALLYPAPEPYARIVEEQLTAAGIPANGQGVRPLSDRLLGRWLLDLLALRDRRFARPAVLGLLAGAPVRDDGRRLPTGAWERLSREAGVVHDRAEWRDKPRRLAAELRERAEREAGTDDPRAWLVDRLCRDADAAEQLGAFVGRLVDDLDRAYRSRTWGALAQWCRSMATRHLGEEQARQRWPEAERDAAERVERALDRLAALDEVEEQTSPSLFARALELELDSDLGRVGELGRGVLVGTPTAALGIDLDLVVVLGLAEGVFPTRPHEDSLLPDSEREQVADELPPRAERPHVEHRHLLAALAASGEQRILTYPRGDLRRSVEREPSRWLLDAVEARRGDGLRALPEQAPWVTGVPSFAGRVAALDFPATLQEYGLRALEDVGDREALLAHPFVARDGVLAAGVALVLGRRGEAFTRYDGNLSALAGQLPSPADPDRVVSTSQVESWLSCPHAYLVGRLLRVEPVDNPEELLEISALDRGSLIHDVLETWLRERIDGGEVPPPHSPWPAAARARLGEIAEEQCRLAAARGLTGRGILWRRDRTRILADLDRFLDVDDRRRRTFGLIPDGVELAFGFADEGAVVDLGDGRTVRIRGRIDRLDRGVDGALFVTDYKTGSDRRYTALDESSPLGDGTKLQLAVYGLAVQQRHTDAPRVETSYWFTTTKGRFRERGYTLNDHVVAELRRALRVAVDGIERGHFPMKPPEPGWSKIPECRYCDPDELGTAERHRAWEQLRHAPALRDYVAFIDPDALGEEATT